MDFKDKEITDQAQGEPEIMHAEDALNEYGKLPKEFIKVTRDEQGRAHVEFTIQSAPVGEVGVNGCQAMDMLEYVRNLFESLNTTFPCHENSMTINKTEEALCWQNKRTSDRENRGVEGKHEA